jgi:hypothetical protein
MLQPADVAAGLAKRQVVMGLKPELYLDASNNRTNWRRNHRMGLYHNLLRADERKAWPTQSKAPYRLT